MQIDPIINQYLDHYQSIGIKIDSNIDQLTAELVAKNVCLIHNALGYAIKDLVMIMSMKFVIKNNNENRDDYESSIDKQIQRFQKQKSQSSVILNQIISSCSDNSAQIINVQKQTFGDKKKINDRGIENLQISQNKIENKRTFSQLQSVIEIGDDELQFDRYAYKKQPTIKRSVVNSFLMCEICNKVTDSITMEKNSNICKKCRLKRL